MKILLLNQAFYPDSVSTSQYVTDLARDLAARGFEISVVCGRRDYTDRQRLYSRFEVIDKIRIHRVSSTRFGRRRLLGRAADALTYDLSAFWHLLRLPRHDLVVAFTSPPLVGLYGSLTARLWRAPFAHWVMNINHEVAFVTGDLRRNGLPGRALTAAYRLTLRSADRVVVMDDHMKEVVERERLVHPQNIVVVPLWPTQERRGDGHESDSVSEFAGMLAGKFTVVHSGNLSQIHPLDTVLGAATRLKDDPSIVFVFIGGGARERDIDDHASRHGLANIMKLPYQPREKLSRSLSFAGLHLVVMGENTSGLAHSSKIYSILEAGAPYVFVGPRQSHIVDDVLHQSLGATNVENGDVDGLISAIAAAKILSPNERDAIRLTNRALATSQFSRDRGVTRFVDEIVRPLSREPFSGGPRLTPILRFDHREGPHVP